MMFFYALESLCTFYEQRSETLKVEILEQVDEVAKDYAEFETEALKRRLKQFSISTKKFLRTILKTEGDIGTS